MSLLIKALDKAQAEKAQAKESADKKQTDLSNKRAKTQGEETPKITAEKSINTADDSGLSLSPPEEDLSAQTKVNAKSDDVPTALKGSAADIAHNAMLGEAEEKPALAASNKKMNAQLTLEEASIPPTQAQAANVFAAKRIEPTYQKTKLALIVGLVALLLMATFFYWYQSVFNAPEIVIPPRPVISQEMPEPLPELSVAEAEPVVPNALEMAEESTEALNTPESKVVDTPDVTEIPVNEAQKRPKSIMAANEAAPDVKKTLSANEVIVDDTDKISRSDIVLLDAGVASESASINVTQTKTESGVNPILLRAYEAYNAGNDQQALQDYKQVLQRYGMNVDAMLGLGAIATRQGRLADASDWYQKVLEVEPRNEIAKAGLISLQQANQPQHSESNVKSMLATTPDDTNLHAALGDIYASQGRWSAAQQAYFDAYRISQSAENAFNLGVSLDQLGKSKQALPYYQEALQKADQSSAIDTVALEARISSIQ